MAVMFNPAQHPRGPGGEWKSASGSGSARAQQGKKGTAKSGANDLYQVSKAAGVTEAKLLKLNPGLRKLAGSGRSVPLGATIATTSKGSKAAAKSQAGHAAAITRRVAAGQTKLAAAAHKRQVKAERAAKARTAARAKAAAKPKAAASKTKSPATPKKAAAGKKH